MELDVENKRLQFWDASMYGEDLFFSARNFNGLFCMEKDRTEAEFIGHFPEEVVWQKNLHSQVISINDKLYFIPFQGTGVSIFDIKSKEFFYVNIEDKQPVEISKAFVVGDDIFMVPLNLKKPFILFHTVSNAYEMKRELQQKILKQFSGKQEIRFGGYGSCAVGQKIYLAVSGTNRIISLDLDSQQVNIYKLPIEYKLRNIYYDRGKLYFTLSDQYKIICWDIDTENHYEYIIENRLEDTYHPYLTVLRWKERLLLLPDQTDKIWELNEEKNIWCMKPDYIPNEFRRTRKAVSLFLGYQCIEDNLHLLPWAGNGLLSLSESGCKCYEICYSSEIVGLVGEIQKQYAENQISRKIPIYENKEECMDIKSVICILNSTFKSESKKELNESGNKIWDFFR